jgi:hypothetical protein
MAFVDATRLGSYRAQIVSRKLNFGHITTRQHESLFIRVPFAPAPKASRPRHGSLISYSRNDMAFADKLEAALEAIGFEALIDHQKVYAFEDWWKRLKPSSPLAQ